MAGSALEIKSVTPSLGLEGGLVYIECGGFNPKGIYSGSVNFDGVPGHIVSASEDYVIARIPPGVASSCVTLSLDGRTSKPYRFKTGRKIASELHPVANPAIDSEGNIITTISGQRGQKVPFPLVKILRDGSKQPLLADIINPTGLAFDPDGNLYISSRYTGAIYRITRDNQLEKLLDGLGIATGIAFDRDGNLYVGDRSGTIFKVTESLDVAELAHLEPSVSAYHLAFGPDAMLYVSGPTLASQDSIYAISPEGEVSVFFAGFGRPQGLAFDEEGNLYLGASYKGRRGVFKLTPERKVTYLISSPVAVGLAFDGRGNLIVADTESIYEIQVGLKGRPLP